MVADQSLEVVVLVARGPAVAGDHGAAVALVEGDALTLVEVDLAHDILLRLVLIGF